LVFLFKRGVSSEKEKVRKLKVKRERGAKGEEKEAVGHECAGRISFRLLSRQHKKAHFIRTCEEPPYYGNQNGDEDGKKLESSLLLRGPPKALEELKFSEHGVISQ
jgi:hypothetical protein